MLESSKERQILTCCHKIRVLLAEDHIVVREALHQLLEREGDLEIVGEAGDGEEAIQQVSELSPDVAIVDIAMPKLNGVEATKQIKARYPATAVLVLSAHDDDDDEYISALLEAGASGYLLKNVRGQVLIDAIRMVHAGEYVFHPVIGRKVVNRITSTHQDKPQKGELLDQLTGREMEVLKLAAKGMSTKDIAERLTLSVRTVQAHLGTVFSKLQVGSRMEAVLVGIREGWFDVDDMEITDRLSQHKALKFS